MENRTSIVGLLTGTLVVAFAAPAFAEQADILVGDPINGKKLYGKYCASCHGDDGRGGRSGYPLTAADRLNLIRNDQMFNMIQSGKGLKVPKKHAFRKDMKFLQIWDSIAYTRTLHMTLGDFFPDASRYITKVYTIDNNGLERIKSATGKRPKDIKGAVFTFFDFEGEQGRLTFVPQNPILLDKLKKKYKSGYLVFLPFEMEGFAGDEIGIGMDKRGVITRVAVDRRLAGANKVNGMLASLTGQGRLGLNRPFKVKGNKKVKAVAAKVFPLYLQAMETVTQYIVEERERTWADDAVE